MTDTAKKALGLYIHVPFCLRKCHYCDFYSAPSNAAHRAAYVAALCAHLRQKSHTVSGYTVDTVYLGGGTPTVLEVAEIAAILGTVRQCYPLAAEAEITVECNPVTNAEGLFEGLLAAGVNRLSIGLQSTHNNELQALGRLHTYEDFLTTYRAARGAGFLNISVDLMLGIPEQTATSLAETLDRVTVLAPEHISAYGLRVEEGTRFFDTVSVLSLPDEDAVADMQEQTAAALAAAGYEHYEVSNYARPGYRSRHNLRYWLSSPYLGFGPGAHSYFEGVRFETPRDTIAYLAAVAAADTDFLESEPHPIVGKEAQDEYVMLRMRLFEGLDEGDFRTRFGTSFEKAYGDTACLEAAGLLARRDGRIAFTERGMYVSNAILSEWLDFGADGAE